jgi:hypothetical protein
MIKSLENVTYKISFIQFRSFNRIKNYLVIDSNSFKELHSLKKNVYNNEKPKYNDTPKYNNEKPKYNEKQYNNNFKHSQMREVTLIVKPDIQNDIYHLYCLDNFQHEEYVGIACISDYNTSVMMNTLFRKIKENQNLDALEESDDEEEFENEKEDRFVNLEKHYNMVCLYNYKFKKWYPIKIADNNMRIVTQNELSISEKK